MAGAPDGAIWFTEYEADRLARLDPASGEIQEWPRPSKPSRPTAVGVDATGRVWVSELAADTIATFEPKTRRFRVLRLPRANVGVRTLTLDPRGRLWYLGSHSGKLGEIE
jgi:virginiamycin B lyase